MVQQSQQTCPECSGTGEQIKESDKCRDCRGKKTQPQSEILEVNVTRGKQPGSRIPFYNKADEAAGLEAGDIIVILTPTEDEEGADGTTESFSIPAGPITNPASVKRPKFQRLKTGVDLVIEVSISLMEALTGFRLAFRHLDDRIVIVESPKGQAVENEAILSVNGEGMPLEHSPGQCGDLIIKVSVKFPSPQQIRKWTPAQLDQLRAILPPALHQTASTESVLGKTLKKFDEEEYEVQQLEAQPYDPEEHKVRRRNEASVELHVRDSVSAC
jgi:DnaJ family protein A protein 2